MNFGLRWGLWSNTHIWIDSSGCSGIDNQRPGFSETEVGFMRFMFGYNSVPGKAGTMFPFYK